MTAAEMEYVQKYLRELRAAQRAYTAADQANTIAQAALEATGAKAESFDHHPAVIVLPTHAPLQNARMNLGNARERCVRVMLDSPAAFNVLWTVFGLAREEFQ